MESIEILGRSIHLRHKSKEELKQLTVGTKLSYIFYDGEVLGVPLIFLEPKGKNPTPRSCAIVGEEVSNALGVPAVFILKPSSSTERMRLMDKEIYFVMTAKYAHLPMVVAAERVSDRKPAVRMTPIAQFLLLYHLQISSIEGKSPKEIAEIVPYSYESVTTGLTCLADLGICEKLKEGKQRKFHFDKKGKELWLSAVHFVINPIGRSFYCDSLLIDSSELPICGINALAHYSRLNPDPEEMIMITERQYRDMAKQGVFINSNRFDGDYSIEVWKYPTIDNSGFVDRLSLSIALNTIADERVEGEVEQMINNIAWKD